VGEQPDPPIGAKGKITPPWQVNAPEAMIANAFEALQRGHASAHQQKLAMTWLVYECCDYYGLSFRPGEDGRRDTDFAEGKRFVGAQVVKMMNIKAGMLK
jgi:hypothetical protein